MPLRPPVPPRPWSQSTPLVPIYGIVKPAPDFAAGKELPMRNPLRAPEYRVLAAAALEAADKCGLPHVQAKHQHAARTWTDLADAEDARLASRVRMTSSDV